MKKTKKLPTLREFTEELLDMIEEIHDAHIHQEGDAHEDDCSYCAAVKTGRAILEEGAGIVHVTLEQSGGLVDVLGKVPSGVALSLMDYDCDGEEKLCKCKEGVKQGRPHKPHIHRSLDGDL